MKWVDPTRSPMEQLAEYQRDVRAHLGDVDRAIADRDAQAASIHASYVISATVKLIALLSYVAATADIMHAVREHGSPPDEEVH